jgi:hypothetical protein
MVITLAKVPAAIIRSLDGVKTGPLTQRDYGPGGWGFESLRARRDDGSTRGVGEGELLVTVPPQDLHCRRGQPARRPPQDDPALDRHGADSRDTGSGRDCSALIQRNWRHSPG